MASLFTDSLTTLPAQTDSYGFVGYVTDSSVGRHLVFMAAYKKKPKGSIRGHDDYLQPHVIIIQGLSPWAGIDQSASRSRPFPLNGPASWPFYSHSWQYASSILFLIVTEDPTRARALSHLICICSHLIYINCPTEMSSITESCSNTFRGFEFLLEILSRFFSDSRRFLMIASYLFIKRRNAFVVIYCCPHNQINYALDLHKGGLICITGHSHSLIKNDFVADSQKRCNWLLDEVVCQ